MTRSAAHGEGRASAHGLILVARVVTSIHLRCLHWLFGAKVPNACVAMATPPPICTEFEGGVDPAVWFGRGGAVRIRGTKDRVYVSHPDDFIGSITRDEWEGSIYYVGM